MGRDGRQGDECGRWTPRAAAVAAGAGLVALAATLAGCGSPAQPLVGASTDTTAATGRASLPGTSYDRGPTTGQALAVIGVPAGKSIPVQAAPGPGQRVLATVTPQVKRVVAVGRARLVEPAGGVASVWVQATVNGVTGWIDGGHLAVQAATTDLTADLISRLGSRPIDETMLDLGMHVARAYASSEPPSTITVVVAPTVGDLGEITVDVVGLGDDSVAGRRLHVFGTPGEESFTLKSVEATPFCYRGVSASGLCV
jgi:hypothetical protein